METSPRRRHAHRRPLAVALAALVASTGPALGSARSGSANVHREKGGPACLSCHSTDEPTLRARASAQDPMLAPDVDARCASCHDPLDASHRVGVTPKKSVPAALPLSPEGKVICATCHFMHAENDAFGDFVRIDNRKGALCLTCHDLADLQ